MCALAGHILCSSRRDEGSIIDVIATVALAGLGFTNHTSAAPAPAVTLIDAEVAPVNPTLEKLNVLVPMAPVNFRPVKCARPLASLTAVSVPPSVPAPDATPTVTVTPLCNVGLPFTSCN